MSFKRSISNWGNYPVIDCRVTELAFEDEITDYIRTQSDVIARGNGRCYGDASLNPNIFSTLKLNKILSFDPEEGLIRCQAGVLLADILRVILPRKFFLPVTPGTKFVTVGGAIASDVHGKNHHKEGCFSQHLADLKLLLEDGRILHCSRTENATAFWSTCGGMGLTGIILEATFRLKPIETAYIRQENLKAGNLEEVMALFEASAGWTYSVAWIDCSSTGKKQGRSILMRGEHARLDELTGRQKKEPLSLSTRSALTIPAWFPGILLNSKSIKAFNQFYYHRSRPSAALTDYESFFYPLDHLSEWNRMYGRSGFTQYQLVLPRDTSKQGIVEILQKVKASGKGSFLAVLKLFGPAAPEALLSFPMEGYTLSLDFKLEPDLFDLLEELDKIVEQGGGRVYLAKDVRMKAAFFEGSYPNKEAFLANLKALNSGSTFQSLQSRRIGIHSE